MKYPPVANIFAVLIAYKMETKAVNAGKLLGDALREQFIVNRTSERLQGQEGTEEIVIIGPAKASLGKVNDIYRHVLYIKHEDYTVLRNIKDFLEGFIEYSDQFKEFNIQLDFNPLSNS